MNWTVLQTMQDLPVTSSLIANMSHKTKWSEMIWDGSSELARKSCREDLKDGGFFTNKERNNGILLVPWWPQDSASLAPLSHGWDAAGCRELPGHRRFSTSAPWDARIGMDPGDRQTT